MKWRMYACADCASDQGVVIVQVPDDAHEDRSSGIDYCPGCGDYLSMTSIGDVEVSGRVALSLLQMRERDRA
jgi:hypothetical protein